MTQKNKVQLKICGANYTIVSEDEPEYVESLGELLDAEMKAVTSANPSLSLIQCAVDQADSCKKATAAADNLRAQIKDYIEDAARSKIEVDVERREIDRLNRELENLRKKLNA